MALFAWKVITIYGGKEQSPLRGLSYVAAPCILCCFPGVLELKKSTLHVAVS